MLKADWIWTKGETLKPAHFAYFRRNVVLSTIPKRAKLLCCADSKYRLWVNSRYVSVGPARGPKKSPYYDTHDISSFLKKGSNTLAFLVEHYTSGSRIFSAVQGGLICQLQIGNKILLTTDKTWKCQITKAYHILKNGYLHFEVFDANLEPANWYRNNYDDSNWDNAKELKKYKLALPSNLMKRPIPMLSNRLYRMTRILSAGISKNKNLTNLLDEDKIAISLKQMDRQVLCDNLFSPKIKVRATFPHKGIVISPPNDNESIFIEIDFGCEILATPVLKINAPAGVIIDIGYSEVLENDEINPYRQNIFSADRIITRKGVTEHRINQPRGFRFILLRIANFAQKIHLQNIYAYEEIYPSKQTGVFKSSDLNLEKIYNLSIRTMNLCMEDAFTDCPWRERQQWLGDIYVEALTAMYGLGGFDITKKAILEFASSNTQEGWIPSVYPGGNNLNLPTFGMKFPVIIWDYYIYTGEKEILKTTYNSLKKLMSYLSNHTDKNGFFSPAGKLSEKYPQIWNFLDWTKLDRAYSDGAIQGYYLEALDTIAIIASELNYGKDAKYFYKNSKKLRKNIAKHFWSEDKKCFLKYRLDRSTLPLGVPKDLVGQHENFLFPLLNIGSKTMRKKALLAIAGNSGKYLPDIGGLQSSYLHHQTGNTINQKIIMIGTPFWSHIALKSLFNVNKTHEALEYIRICWGLMLDNDATSCWEMWSGTTSLCHGFSTGPASLLSQYILGIKPIKPGFKIFEVAPRLVDLDWAKGSVPIKKGEIAVDWRRNKNDSLKVNIKVPAKTSCQFIIPSEFSKARYIFNNGKKQRVISRITLNSGKHRLSVSIKPRI